MQLRQPAGFEGSTKRNPLYRNSLLDDHDEGGSSRNAPLQVAESSAVKQSHNNGESTNLKAPFQRDARAVTKPDFSAVRGAPGMAAASYLATTAAYVGMTSLANEVTRQ